MEQKRLEKLVGFLEWDFVNCNNLILDQKKYSDLKKRAKPIEGLDGAKPIVEDDSFCTERLREEERDKKCKEEEKECGKLEIDLKYCEDRAKQRRLAIDQAKEILKRNFHENKVFNRAVCLVDLLQQNKDQVKENRDIEEENKMRETQKELRFMAREHQKDAERKDRSRELRMEVNDDNIKIVQLNLEKQKKLDVEEREWAEEILCLTKEFEKEQKEKKIKNFEKRKQLDAANQLEIERKEKLRQFNIKLDAMEDEEAMIFLETKRKMYKDMIHNSKKQDELRQKHFDLVVEKTKEWFFELDPEGVRDKWYTDVYTREAMARERDGVIDVQKRKENYMNLVKYWDEQVKNKLKDRCQHELEEKLCFEVRLQMDCDMKKEDEDRRKKVMTIGLAQNEFNKRLENEKKNANAFEKQYDKEHLDKMYEWIATKEKEQLVKRDCLMKKYLDKGMDVTPLMKINFKK